MATNHPEQHTDNYEKRDANIPALLKFAVGMAVVIAVTLIGMKFTFNHFFSEPLGPPANPFEDTRRLPPGPRIQALPHMELSDYCKAQQAEVDGYAWLNKAQGTARIPIDRAMDIVAQQGLPARPATTGGPDLPGISVGMQNTQAASYLDGPCGYLATQAAENALVEEAPKD